MLMSFGGKDDGIRKLLRDEYDVLEYGNNIISKIRRSPRPGASVINYRHTYIEFPSMEAKTAFIVKWVH